MKLKQILALSMTVPIFCTFLGATNINEHEDGTITDTVTVQSENKDETYSFENQIEHEGKTYVLKDTSSQVLEEKAVGEDVTFEHTESDFMLLENADFAEKHELKTDTGSYILDLKEVTYETILTDEKTISLEQGVTINKSSYAGDHKEYITVPYYYEEYGVTIEIPLYYNRTEDDNWQWIDDVIIPVKMTGVDGAYILFEGEMIPFDGTVPPLAGYEDLFLNYLHLDSKFYRLNSAQWNGDIFTDENGVICQNATIYGERNVATFTAFYGGHDTVVPQTEILEAKAHYEAVYEVPSDVEKLYKIEHTAVYEEVEQIPFWVQFLQDYGISILLFLAIITAVIILYILAKKRKNKKGEVK